ncbi:MAG: hypothetical protein JWO62_1362 [Acidimicrobiaceae bacterium]|nr:hypothetical protein [Acidimicrobiaceae bacterium]
MIARFASSAAAHHHVPVTLSDSEPEETDDYTATNRSTYDRLAKRYVENQIRQRTGNEHSLLGKRTPSSQAFPTQRSWRTWDVGRGSTVLGSAWRDTESSGWTSPRECSRLLIMGLLDGLRKRICGHFQWAAVGSTGSGVLQPYCISLNRTLSGCSMSSGGPCGTQEASRWSRPWVNRRGLKWFLTLLTSDAGSCIDARIGSECNWRRRASRSAWRIRSLAIGIG